MNKIFCIGLNKTGSMSLYAALKILGFKTAHYTCTKGNIHEIMRDNSEHNRMLLSGMEEYDAYSDFFMKRKTYHFFKIMDEQYPNSKFILNIRDLSSWLRSRKGHVLKKLKLRKYRKQNPHSTWYNIDQAAWRKEFEEHSEDVLFYFRNRPADLLVINIPASEGWEKLCPFLGVPIPNESFPHENKTDWGLVFRQILNRAFFR